MNLKVAGNGTSLLLNSQENVEIVWSSEISKHKGTNSHGYTLTPIVDSSDYYSAVLSIENLSYGDLQRLMQGGSIFLVDRTGRAAGRLVEPKAK
jgi:hypothetical protein